MQNICIIKTETEKQSIKWFWKNENFTVIRKRKETYCLSSATKRQKQTPINQREKKQIYFKDSAICKSKQKTIKYKLISQLKCLDHCNWKQSWGYKCTSLGSQSIITLWTRRQTTNTNSKLPPPSTDHHPCISNPHQDPRHWTLGKMCPTPLDSYPHSLQLPHLGHYGQHLPPGLPSDPESGPTPAQNLTLHWTVWKPPQAPPPWASPSPPDDAPPSPCLAPHRVCILHTIKPPERSKASSSSIVIFNQKYSPSNPGPPLPQLRPMKPTGHGSPPWWPQPPEPDHLHHHQIMQDILEVVSIIGLLSLSQASFATHKVCQDACHSLPSLTEVPSPGSIMMPWSPQLPHIHQT